MSNLVTANSQSVGMDLFDPEVFQTAQKVCRMLAQSELVPDIYRTSDKNPEPKAIANCMIALELSRRIGASYMAVMQNMVPIQGRPSWSAKFLIATVNTCGRFEPLKYRFETKGKVGMVSYNEFEWNQATKRNEMKTIQFDGSAMDNIECVCWTRAVGSDEKLESSPISIKMAIEEGWYTKKNSKWKSMPQQMLIYRSASFWTNAYAPDVSMGMRTYEEEQDIQDISYEEVKEDAKIIVKNEIDKKQGKKTVDFVDKETGEVTQVDPGSAQQSNEKAEEKKGAPVENKTSEDPIPSWVNE